MKTRISFIASVIVAALNCTLADAQVLGGNVGGAIGGTLSGGMRDTSVLTRGHAQGAFGSEVDTRSLMRTTRGTAGAVRNRAESAVATSRETSAKATTSAAASATQTAAPKLKELPKLDSKPVHLTGDAKSSASASSDGVSAQAAADGNVSTSVKTNR
jgi:hypothetical protein